MTYIFIYIQRKREGEEKKRENNILKISYVINIRNERISGESEGEIHWRARGKSCTTRSGTRMKLDLKLYYSSMGEFR